MEVKAIQTKGNMIHFLIKKTNATFVNTLRRMILDEVPTMAIETVEFRKNDSILYDEMVAHRLGLIPLKTDLKAYNIPDKCTCKGEGCAKCQVHLTLKTKASGMIDAGKLKSKDPAIVPVYETIPITKLENDQELELTATAELGRGKNHTKWSPGFPWFRKKPEVSGKVKAGLNMPKALVDASGKVNEEQLLIGPSVDVLEDVEGVTLTFKDDEYVFSFESWGQLPAAQVIKISIDELDAKLDALEKAVNAL